MNADPQLLEQARSSDADAVHDFHGACDVLGGAVDVLVEVDGAVLGAPGFTLSALVGRLLARRRFTTGDHRQQSSGHEKHGFVHKGLRL